MDNNPFRSQNANMYTGIPSGQTQLPQANTMPSATNHGQNGLLVDTSVPGSAQQQQPYYSPQSQTQQSFYQPMGNPNFGYSQAPQQSTTYPFIQQPQQQQQPSFQQQQQQQPPFYNTAPATQHQPPNFYTNGSYGGPASFPQYQQQPQAYDPSNVFIPSSFGVSSSDAGAQHQYQQQQQRMPQRPAVDAGAYLKKSGKVRKEECPICHKTIEGDDPAINHHVNEHLEYDI